MKQKNLKITEETHSKYKEHCIKNGLKLNVFIDKILKEYWEKNIDEWKRKMDKKMS